MICEMVVGITGTTVSVSFKRIIMLGGSYALLGIAVQKLRSRN